jgi:hypothetical protein
MVAGQFDQAVRVLSAVNAAGTRCYTLSDMGPHAFTIRSARFPFMTWFDGHVISGLEGVAKPDHRIFEILLDATVLLPGRPTSSTTHRATPRPPARSGSTPCTTPEPSSSGNNSGRSASQGSH